MALRKAGFVGDNGLKWMPSDYLGSTSVVANVSGASPATQGYMPWGETRYGSVPTSYQYTGQFNDGYIKLLWYGSRWLDPELGRWIQPDSIVPVASQGVQAWDRYTHVNNNPVRYNDPSGHMIDSGCNYEGCEGDPNSIEHIIRIGKFRADKPGQQDSPAQDETLTKMKGSQWWVFLVDAGSTIGQLISQAFNVNGGQNSNVFVYLHYSESADGSTNIGGVSVVNHTGDPLYVSKTKFTGRDFNSKPFCADCPDYAVPKPRNSDWIAVVPPKGIKSIPSPSDNVFYDNPSYKFQWYCPVEIDVQFWVPSLGTWRNISYTQY